MKPNPKENKPLLLIVEDDERFQETLKIEFNDRGYETVLASSLATVQALGKELPLRFAVVDLRLASEFGISVVEYLRLHFPTLRIIVLTGYGSIATAVEAVKKGASQYITKPVQINQLEQLLWTDAPLSDALPDAPEPVSLARHEREYIEWVLVQASGNITEAAKRLGIFRQSLQRKLRKFTPR